MPNLATQLATATELHEAMVLPCSMADFCPPPPITMEDFGVPTTATQQAAAPTDKMPLATIRAKLLAVLLPHGGENALMPKQLKLLIGLANKVHIDPVLKGLIAEGVCCHWPLRGYTRS